MKFGPKQKHPSIKDLCRILCISTRTYYKWRDNPEDEDKRATCERLPNPRKFSSDEVKKLFDMFNSEETRDKTYRQAYHYFLKKREFYGSDSTACRYAKALGKNDKRRDHNKERDPNRPANNRPPEGTAYGPNEIWCWDATPYGQYTLYAITDVYSRMCVGWGVYPADNAANALDLWRRTLAENGIEPGCSLRVHADNGAAMRAYSTVELFKEYGIYETHSRPNVSDDNPISEALFSTLNRRKGLDRPYASIEECRAACAQAIYEYNYEDFHSSLNMVTPAIRHESKEAELAFFAARRETLETAKAANSLRWIGGKVMNCEPEGPQKINHYNKAIVVVGKRDSASTSEADA